MATDHYIEVSEKVFAPIYPFLAESVKSRTGLSFNEMRVIDLGGGSGLWAEAMLDKGAKFVSLVDVSPEMVDYADERLQKKFSTEQFRIILADAANLPIDAASHNVIISRSSMHMWENLERAWNEIYRVLQPGGAAFLGRGYGPDIPEHIRNEVKLARKHFKQKIAMPAGQEEPPSPDPFYLAKLGLEIGFSEVSLIRDHKAVWLLAKKAKA